MAGLEFRLLGPLMVLDGGRPVTVGGPRQQIVLVMLLLEVGQVVSVERLVEAVWGDAPPKTVRSQIQMAISDLRSRFRSLCGEELIAHHPAGYRIDIGSHPLDLVELRRAVEDGRRAVRRGDLTAGVAGLRAALALWRGRPALGLESSLLDAAAVRLEEDRLAVLEECLGLELQLGRHLSIIGELRELVAANPLREELHAHLMVALHRAGRQAEALEAFGRARRLLADEYGLDPSPRLVELERAILRNDPQLVPAATEGISADSTPATLAGPWPNAHDSWSPPRQLPSAIPDFVGRASAMAEIRARLAARGRSGVSVIVISGPGGVGKTTLAISAAHSLRDSFPDGQLFARLDAGEARSARPEHVLEQFLRALGVSPTALPSSLDELAAMYRSRLADASMLVVLDNVPTVDSVLPLLPGGSGCAVLVTSRRPLHGIPGARRIDLDVFEPEVSLNLLSNVLGAERVQAEAEAGARLAACCGHLPLALRIAAAKLSVRQHWSLDRMASRLGDEQRRLDELALDGTGVRASILLSYETLGTQSRRLLLLLAMLGPTDFADWFSAPLLDLDVDAAVDVLEELAEVWLVSADSSRQPARYRLHDLVRIFARELLVKEIPLRERVAALNRLVRCQLFLARQAHVRVYGGDFTVLHSSAEGYPLPATVTDELLADPIEWLDSEHANIVAAVGLAAQQGFTDVCWDLAVTSVTLFESKAYPDSWRDTHTIALAAAQRAGDQRAVAVVRYSIGALALYEDRFDDAERELTAALDWFTRSGDSHGRGLALRNLAMVDRLRGRDEVAMKRYADALSELRSVGDLAAEAHTLSGVAQIHLDRNEADEAERLLTEALAACLRSGSRRSEAQVRHRLGAVFLAQGRLGDAELQYHAVLNAVATADDPIGSGYAWLGIGQVRLARGDLDQAQAALERALVAIERTGDRLSRGRVLLTQAELNVRRGNPRRAAGQLAEAEQLFVTVRADAWATRAAQMRTALQSPEHS